MTYEVYCTPITDGIARLHVYYAPLACPAQPAREKTVQLVWHHFPPNFKGAVTIFQLALDQLPEGRVISPGDRVKSNSMISIMKLIGVYGLDEKVRISIGVFSRHSGGIGSEDSEDT